MPSLTQRNAEMAVDLVARLERYVETLIQRFENAGENAKLEWNGSAV